MATHGYTKLTQMDNILFKMSISEKSIQNDKTIPQNYSACLSTFHKHETLNLISLERWLSGKAFSPRMQEIGVQSPVATD